MKTLKELSFLNLLNTEPKFRLEIEDRIAFKRTTYGMNNHAEFIDYHNPHDNCLWDAVVPGYRKKMNGGNKYKTTKIIGAYVLDNGNHKIAVKVNCPGYSSIKAKTDMKRYITNYKNKIPVNGKWVELEGF